MRSVGIKLLKNKLSEYIRLAAGGETVLVTDRDRVVAELVRLRRAGAHWFRMRFCSMPFVRGGSGHRYRLEGNAGTKTGDEAARNLGRFASRSSGSMIYLDSSVALAYLLAEDRYPSNALCNPMRQSSSSKDHSNDKRGIEVLGSAESGWQPNEGAGN